MVDGDTLEHNKVAYLWATSSVFSGVNALFETTKDLRYAEWLEETMLPIIECYWTSGRLPEGFQSYPFIFGYADRYYDDNAWVGLEFLKIYQLLDKDEYLEKAKIIWEFIASGYDDKLGGGFYWCEQKKFQKNACSNAPVSVFSLKLYQMTSQEKYLDIGKKIYHWMKTTLRDSNNGLYNDYISLDGKVDKRKYAYNSGQMLQAASLLYVITNESRYLEDARNLAESCAAYFFKTSGGDDKSYSLLKNGQVWFATVMLRGFEELYRIDKNPLYISVYKRTLELLWKEGRDADGLFCTNRLSEPSRFANDEKWLLIQGALVEMYARLSVYE